MMIYAKVAKEADNVGGGIFPHTCWHQGKGPTGTRYMI